MEGHYKKNLFIVIQWLFHASSRRPVLLKPSAEVPAQKTEGAATKTPKTTRNISGKSQILEVARRCHSPPKKTI